MKKIYAFNARSECSLGVQIPTKLAQGELMKEEMLRFSTNLKRKKGNVVDLTTSFFYSLSFSVFMFAATPTDLINSSLGTWPGRDCDLRKF